jgi:signal transduction histidine kinase
MIIWHKPLWMPWFKGIFGIEIAVQGVCYSALGLVVIAHRSRQLAGWLLLVTGWYFATGPTLRLLTAEHLPTGLALIALAWLIPTFWYIPGTWDNWLPLWFPTGRLPDRRWRMIIAVFFAGLLFEGLVKAGASPTVYKVHGVTNPVFYSWWGPMASSINAYSYWPDVVSDNFGVVVIAFVLLRWKYMSERQRRQLAIVLPIYALWRSLNIADDFSLVPGWLTIGIGISAALWPIAVGYSITRDRLWELDRAARRVITGTALTAALVVTYVVGAVVLSGGRTLPKVAVAVVAGLAGLAWRPMRIWLRRRVDRIFYGERARPYEVVRVLAGRLRDGLSPTEVPDAVCQTVVNTLRLPAAVLETPTRGGLRQLASVGTMPATAQVEVFELRYQGAVVGRLLVRPRVGQRELDELDTAVVQSLADQSAPAVSGLRLSEELQASREGLVAAREEERRRLRRDLHDGIGPTLAGARLRLDTASTLVPDPTAANLLHDVARDIGAVIADLRQITDNLRPPALDQLGLGGAVRELALRLSSPTLQIRSKCPEKLPALPAAVDVAAYRIIAEALANLIRHAQASEAIVEITTDLTTVSLDVVDNGIGLPPRPRLDGIGLASIRERAQEIGGHCAITTDVSGGTRVHVVLPRILA